MDRRELPKERLATTDERGNRVFLYPADVRGRLKNWRQVVQAVLLLIFLVLPWIRIGGTQALLLDIPHRRFAVFGLTFWAHEAPLLFFVLAGTAAAIALVTALWGRIWCGWACPETVFTEAVFRRIERWIEGDAVTRRRRDQGPWTTDKIWKKSAKWAAFLAVTLVISHSFLAYFVGTEELALMVRRSPAEHPTAFMIMASITGTLLFAFGWFREQFCVIMCPYGRIQATLMDSDSLAVLYDEKRGEPRRGLAAAGTSAGDCVNCYRCVQVCPTGIDIRRGLQMECIACTACIDACDEVMRRTHRPTGLIRYDRESHHEGRRPRHLRPRTLFYSAFLALMVTGLSYSIATREKIQTTVLRAKDTPYQIVPEGVINHFKISVSNLSFRDARIEVALSAADRERGFELVMVANPMVVAAGQDGRADFFVRFPRSALKNGGATATVELTSGLAEHTRKEIRLVGPFE